jgi:hypothetical protein
MGEAKTVTGGRYHKGFMAEVYVEIRVTACFNFHK